MFKNCSLWFINTHVDSPKVLSIVCPDRMVWVGKGVGLNDEMVLHMMLNIFIF